MVSTANRTYRAISGDSGIRVLHMVAHKIPKVQKIADSTPRIQHFLNFWGTKGSGKARIPAVGGAWEAARSGPGGSGSAWEGAWEAGPGCRGGWSGDAGEAAYAHPWTGG